MTTIQKCRMYLVILTIVYATVLAADADDRLPCPLKNAQAERQLSAEDERRMNELFLNQMECLDRAEAAAARTKREIEARRKRIEQIKRGKPRQSVNQWALLSCPRTV